MREPEPVPFFKRKYLNIILDIFPGLFPCISYNVLIKHDSALKPDVQI